MKKNSTTPSSTTKSNSSPLASNLDRRQFLRRAGAASIAAGVTMTGFKADPAAATACGPLGNRSLVCIFLEGGADGFNMYTPLNTTQTGSTYTDYALTRTNMALPRASLLPAGNGDFGFNTDLPAFAEMFNRGDMAVVSNVGPLSRPTSQADVIAGRGLPQSLFAHDAQQRLWQTATASVGGADQGWGGQIAENIDGCDPDPLVSAAVSALGSSVFLGTAAGGYLRLTPNQTLHRMFGFDPTVASWYPSDQRNRVASALREVLDAASSSESELERLVAGTTEQAILTNAQLEDVTSSPIDMASGGTLQSQLRLVAQLINNRERLGMSRQVFFVRMGGWDTHGEHNRRFPVLLQELNSAVDAFQTALGPSTLNVADSVTTFTVTDFGRTLTSNGNGSDHGWGNHAFVFGGSVNGGQHYGEVPNFSAANNPDDVGNGRAFGGRLIPQFSVGQYGATLARWAGVEDSELNGIFPDLREFNSRDLGFMA